MIILNIGNRIKDLRELKGLTQKQLGEKIGVTAETIARYENSNRNPNIETLNKIAEALGVTINELAGNKKTITQDILDGLIDSGLTLEQISQDTEIPIKELENMHQNPDNFTLGAVQKLGKYINITDEQIVEWLAGDAFINSTYNNDGKSPEKDALKKMFLGKTLSLDEVLMNASEEDKEFLTQIYYAGVLNTNGIIKDNTSREHASIKLDVNALDVIAPIEHSLKFMQIDNYQLNKLNNKALRYLCEKITDLLEVEFYKLKKNNFEVPNNEENS